MKIRRVKEIVVIWMTKVENQVVVLVLELIVIDSHRFHRTMLNFADKSLMNMANID